MRWNRFFEDLEHQLDSEWEVQQASVDGEAERLRVSRVELRTRLTTLIGGEITVDLPGAHVLSGQLTAVGADWIGLARELGGASLVPLSSVQALRFSHEAMLGSLGVGGDRGDEPRKRTSLAERQSFGFVLRDLARRRIPVVLHRGDEHTLAGTIDRVGVDHLDLALHDRGAPRREAEVSGYRIVPLAAVAWVQLDRLSALLAH